MHIHRITILEYLWPHLRLDIRCSRGTYIRAIARDLGTALGCGACCQTLTRSAVGPFRTLDAINLDTASPQTVLAGLVPVPDVLQLVTSA